MRVKKCGGWGEGLLGAMIGQIREPRSAQAGEAPAAPTEERKGRGEAREGCSRRLQREGTRASAAAPQPRARCCWQRSKGGQAGEGACCFVMSD